MSLTNIVCFDVDYGPVRPTINHSTASSHYASNKSRIQSCLSRCHLSILLEDAQLPPIIDSVEVYSSHISGDIKKVKTSICITHNPPPPQKKKKKKKILGTVWRCEKVKALRSGGLAIRLTRLQSFIHLFIQKLCYLHDLESSREMS